MYLLPIFHITWSGLPLFVSLLVWPFLVLKHTKKVRINKGVNDTSSVYKYLLKKKKGPELWGIFPGIFSLYFLATLGFLVASVLVTDKEYCFPPLNRTAAITIDSLWYVVSFNNNIDILYTFIPQVEWLIATFIRSVCNLFSSFTQPNLLPKCQMEWCKKYGKVFGYIQWVVTLKRERG